MSEQESVKYEIEYLREFSSRVFMHCGMLKADADQAADVLITADLWGIDAHGIARLNSYYKMLIHGQVNPRPNIRIIREMPGTANVDGDNGLGLVVGSKANEIAMEKAEFVGTGWVSVYNSTHFGIAGYYPFKALNRDLIGWAMTNTPPKVAPLWGRERMLGTNPIAIAFPGHHEPPIIIDMATSTVSYGRVENATRRSETLPIGCIADCTGIWSIYPEDMIDGGSILPLGIDRERGGHKGYCLSAMVDILCGVLSGANWGPFVPAVPVKSSRRTVGKGLGHLFGALLISGFTDPIEFKKRIDDWIRVFRTAKPIHNTPGPLIPGDPERRAQAIQLSNGVELLPSVVEELRNLGLRTGILFD